MPSSRFHTRSASTSLGRKKEKHVKKNVIAALLPVVGLAAIAAAQTNAPTAIYTNAFGTLELRWAVDGSGRNAEAANPLDASLVNLVPGVAATQVGLTLQARIATTTRNTTIPTTVARQGNYGIGRVSFGTSNSYNRIVHNDSVASASLSRGQTTVGNTSGPISTDAGDGTPNDSAWALFGATSQFRFFTGGYGGGATNANNWNSANGNAVANQAVRSGFVPDQGLGGYTGIGVNATLSGSNRARIANGFQAADRSSIAAFDASVPTQIGGNQNTNFISLAPGVFSPWVNIYRVTFQPRENAGTDNARNVTVTFNGNVQYISAASFSSGIQQTLLRVDSFLGTATDAVAVATFTVPTPATAALLGLGGLMAARRRRA